MLEGEGGNITIAVGDDGVIMVDSEFAPLHDKIKAAIEKATNQPIKYLVDTHFHGGRTGGNALFHRDGATVVANVNVRNRLAAGTTNGLSSAKTPPAETDALPTQTYNDRSTLKVKGRMALLGHPKNAHTMAILMSCSGMPTYLPPATSSPTAATPTSTSPTAAISRV